MIKNDVYEKVIALYVQDANDRKESAGYNGEYSDGGYSGMMSYLEAFQAGILFANQGTFPEFLKPYLTTAKNELDNEWDEFQRLKEKFENKK